MAIVNQENTMKRMIDQMKMLSTCEGKYDDPMMFTMIGGSSYLPKENKSKPLGEDAHFILEDDGAIGVADGVGGWSKQGVDAGEYSRELMRNAAISVKKHRMNSNGAEVDPKRVLGEAFMKTEVAKGSSTACIITITGRSLRAANLGDSGFLVIRRGVVVYGSRAQQHKFNHPYQLGRSEGCDKPAMAERITVPLEKDDVIVAGTDGLFDNVFPEEIGQVVQQIRRDYDYEPELLAYTLANKARRYSLDQRRSSPFAVEAKRAGISFSGGKYDDVTVVVAYVVPCH